MTYPALQSTESLREKPRLSHEELLLKATKIKESFAGQTGNNWWLGRLDDRSAVGRGHGCYGSMAYGGNGRPYIHTEMAVFHSSGGKKAHDELKKDAPQEWTKLVELTDYVINRSIFAPALLTKDPEDFLSSGSLIDTDFPSRFSVSGMQTIRAATSYKRYLPYLFEKLKKVVGEDAALPIMLVLVIAPRTLGPLYNPKQSFPDFDKASWLSDSSHGYMWFHGASHNKISYSRICDKRAVGLSHLPSLRDHSDFHQQYAAFWEKKEADMLEKAYYSGGKSGPAFAAKNNFDYIPGFFTVKNVKDPFGYVVQIFESKGSVEEWAQEFHKANYLGEGV